MVTTHKFIVDKDILFSLKSDFLDSIKPIFAENHKIPKFFATSLNDKVLMKIFICKLEQNQHNLDSKFHLLKKFIFELNEYYSENPKNIYESRENLRKITHELDERSEEEIKQDNEEYTKENLTNIYCFQQD